MTELSNHCLAPHSFLGGLFIDLGPTCPSRDHTAWSSGEAPLAALAARAGGAYYLDQECLPHVVLDPKAHDLDLHIHFACFKWEKHEGHHLGGGGGHDNHLAGRGSWLCRTAQWLLVGELHSDLGQGGQLEGPDA